MHKIPALALVALAVGTLLRAIALPLPGTNDVGAWKAWSYYATTVGVAHVYGEERPTRRHTFQFGDSVASVNYPPLAVGELAVIGHLYRRAMGGAFPNTRALTITIKSAIFVMDVVLLLVLAIAVGRTGGAQGAWWAAAAFWANPAAILTSALGYIDVWFAVPAVAALAAATFGRPIAAGVLVAAGALTKPQALFVAPSVALALWDPGDRAAARLRLWPAIAAGTCVTALFVAPMVLAGTTLNMLRAVGSMTRHTLLSGNACNLWWVVGYGVQVADALREGTGLLQAVMLHADILLMPESPALALIARVGGTTLTAAASVWALSMLVKSGRARDLGLQAATAAFLVHAYFTLSPQVHENHFFLAVPLLVVAASLLRQYGPVLTVLSVIFALNLYLFYGITGEEPPAIMRTMTVIDSTVLLAIANCAALAWHARILARVTASREWLC